MRAALAAECMAPDGADVEIDRLVVDVDGSAPTDGLGRLIARGIADRLQALGGQAPLAQRDGE
jgi:hypothetical protein